MDTIGLNGELGGLGPHTVTEYARYFIILNAVMKLLLDFFLKAFFP
jgi:hypothetical protein